MMLSGVKRPRERGRWFYELFLSLGAVAQEQQSEKKWESAPTENAQGKVRFRQAIFGFSPIFNTKFGVE